MAGLPDDATLANLDTIDKIRQYCRCSEVAWNSVDAALGHCQTPILLALLPAGTLKWTLVNVRIAVTGGGEPRLLTAMETIQVAYMWRVARRTAGMEDMDPLSDPPTTVSAAPAATTSPTKKIKTSSVLDQMDESEVQNMSRAELNQAYLNHIEITGAEPPHDCDPTVEQIVAMKDRVILRGEAPYADFSILTPFGKTMQRQLKTRSWILQQDGTFRALDIPGPPSFEAWKSCWRVFRSILFMLRYPSAGGAPEKRVVTSACLEEYYEKVVKLTADFPETWHLIMKAEDRCRSEMLERYRRQLTKAAFENRLPMNLDFDGSQPWIGVFTYAARNSEYWDEQVVKPATIFIARGGRHMTSEKADRVNVPESAMEALENARRSSGSAGEEKHPGGGPNLKKKKKPKGKVEDSSDTGQAPPVKKKKSGGGDHPRSWGKQYITMQDGREICFTFAKGAVNACPEPCKDMRAHACQLCLGSHRNADCPQKKTKPGKGSGKNN